MSTTKITRLDKFHIHYNKFIIIIIKLIDLVFRPNNAQLDVSNAPLNSKHFCGTLFIDRI